MVFFLFFLFVFMFVPLASRALVTDTVGILPAYPDNNVKASASWFIYNLKAGEEKLDAVMLINNKDETVVLKIYAVDAMSTVDGGFALASETDPNSGVGTWVKLAANEIELPPKTEKLIPFTFTVPKNADTGDHAGGIVIQEIEMVDTGGTMTGVRIISRVGVRIYETVPGEVKKGFEITRFDWRLESNGVASFIKDLLDVNKKTIFTVGIKNKGNVRITPTAMVEVRNMLGIKTAQLDNKSLGVVFPLTENSDGMISWEKAPMFGRYKIKATVKFEEDGLGEDSKEIAIWVFPYRMIFLTIIFVVLFTLVRLIGLYFREAGKEKMPIYQVKLGDNLADLGRKFMAPWRMIAKLNFIGEPFDIKEGEKLFIPISKRNKDLLRRFKEQGELLPSIIERSKESRFKKKKTIIIIIFAILIIAGAIWGIKMRRDKMIHEEISVPINEEKPPMETTERTKAGAFKKSNVDVAILTPGSVDKISSDQLFKKLKLIGYRIKLGGVAPENNYAVTTVEYKINKQEQAEMVRNDLGLKNVNMQEVANLENDVVIYNFDPASSYFDLVHAASVLQNVE
jgi:hypothetical protein